MRCDSEVRLTDTLRTNKEQAKRLGHRIFSDEFFRNNLRFLNRAIPRGHDIEILELAVSIPKWDVRALQQSIRASQF